MRLLFIFILALQSCSAQNSTSAEKHLVDIDQFSRAVQGKKEVQLIDVRTPEEFRQGHIPNAKNIDWRGQDFAEQISELDKTRPVYIYCQSGGRSASAATKLVEEGFEVYELEGGILNWRHESLPETVAELPLKGMNMEDYRKLLQGDKMVLVDFHAKWCGPCKMMKPYLDNISRDLSEKVTIIRIDVDENPKLAKELKIKAIPLMMLYQDQNLLWKNEGYIEEAGIRKELVK